MRLILSLIMLTLIITYLAIPLMVRIRQFIKGETKRIDKALTSNTNEDDMEEK